MMMPVLLYTALLVLLPGTLTQDGQSVSIDVVVENSLLGTPPLMYTTYVVYRGILLGALKRLMNSNANFNFTYTEDLNYGPYLESVNGVTGNVQDHTYWELLVKTSSGQIITPDAGIGCYIPTENEKIILRFTRF